MAKIDHTPATKRDVTRARKESADLWVALTEVEAKLNAIIELKVQRLPELSIELANELKRIRERLESYDNLPLVKGDN